jgi:3-keto-5-aminohexanoate cleavage enzyme
MQTGIGLTVTLRLRLGAASARGIGDSAEPTWVLGLFADVAGELLARLDGDQGELRSLEAVEVLAPLRVGDYLEVTGVITAVGRETRTLAFEARRVVETVRGSGVAPSAADALAEPVAVCRAIGTAVVPVALQRKPRLVLPALAAPPPDVASLPEPRPIITPAPHIIVTPVNTEALLGVTLPAAGRSAREVAEAAAAARDAGAAVVRLEGERGARLDALVREVRARCDALIEVGTDGPPDRDVDARSLALAAQPDLATVAAGSFNRGDGVASTPRALVRELVARVRAAGAAPLLECVGLGDLDEAAKLAEDGALGAAPRLRFLLGEPGLPGAREDVLRALVGLMPPGARFSVAVPATAPDSVAEVAVRLGGDLLLVGHALEDAPARVAAAATLARVAGLAAIDPERARQLLGLRPL